MLDALRVENAIEVGGTRQTTTEQQALSFSFWGLRSVGDNAVVHTIHCGSYAIRLLLCFSLVLFAITIIMIDFDHLVSGGESQLRAKGMVVIRSV